MDTTLRNFLIAVTLLLLVFGATYAVIMHYNTDDCCDEVSTQAVTDSTSTVTDTVCVDSTVFTN